MTAAPIVLPCSSCQRKPAAGRRAPLSNREVAEALARSGFRLRFNNPALVAEARVSRLLGMLESALGQSDLVPAFEHAVASAGRGDRAP